MSKDIVFQDENGKWYFWDEAWTKTGPFDTEDECRKKLKWYCNTFL